MSDNKVFARRLTQLEAILTTVKDIDYDQTTWSMCAIGHAMKHRDIFRGLNLQLDGTPINGLLHDDGSEVISTRSTIEGYFGPGSFSLVFSSFAPLRVDGSYRVNAIHNIQQYRAELLELDKAA